jgi:hypothetical protein
VAVDSAGNVYVGDTSNSTIRKITSAGVVSTLAGLAGSIGSADGTGSAARFGDPHGVAVDSAGNVYVADSGYDTIRKITPAGVVTTLAGLAGGPGSADGTGSAARFNQPYGVAVDSAGNVYVADTANDTIRKITPAGVVKTLAGLASSIGSADDTGSAARFNGPGGVAVDTAGDVYVADSDNNTIRIGGPAVQLVSAVSTKTHGGAGSFNVNLPLTGEPGVECRSSGGNHTLIFTFNNSIVSGSASVTTGVGSVSESPSFAGNTMTVTLTGVADVQKIGVTLSNVTDTFAQVLPNAAISVNMLIGDTSGNKTVNGTDVSQTKLRSGAAVGTANFREDVNVSGSISGTDVSIVKSRSGLGVP